MKTHNHILLHALFALALLTVTVLGQTATDGDWTYNYSTNTLTATVTKYTGSSATPSVPSSFSLRLNTGQKDEDGDYIYKTYSFKVTALSGTFSGNQTITDVSLPSSVTTIGPSTFLNCRSLSSAPINSGIQSLGTWAFSGCTKLSALSFPSSLTSIGDLAFSGCTGLTGIEFSPSLTSIGNSAFNGCTGLTSIRTPTTVKNLGASAFQGCTGLTEATIDGDDLILPSDVLANCSNLVNVTIGNGVTGMNFYRSDQGTYPPFRGDNKLQEVTVGTGITTISNSFCSGLSGLKHVTMRGNIQCIGSGAFSSCSNLKTISLGGAPEVIGDSAFWRCGNLTGSVDFSKCHSIGSSAFYGCSSWPFAELKLPLVTAVNDYTFTNCKGLTGIEFSSSLTSIGNSAFNGCTGLTGIEFSPSLTSIGNSAFYGCTGLTSIRTPTTVKNLGASAFQGCTGLTEATIDGDDLILPSDVLANCSNLVNVTIGNGVTGMNFYRSGQGTYPPFRGDNKLQEVTVGTGITSISNCFCNELSGLQHVTMRGNIQCIGSGAFSSCSNLKTISLGGAPEVIGDSAFWRCGNLTGSVDFSKCHSIGSSAFYGCSSWPFAELKLPLVTAVNDYTFTNCKGLTGIEFSPSLTSIGNSAFNGCTGLANVYFKSNPPSVGSSPFGGAATGARGHYPASHAPEWLPQIGLDGKWQGLIMAEIPAPVVSVQSADPVNGRLTLSWKDSVVGENMTYSVYRGAGDSRASADLVAPAITGNTWTDNDYWCAEPVLKPLNYWVVAQGGGYGDRESAPVETRHRYGVSVGLNEEQGFAADARLCRKLAVENGGFGECTVFTGSAVDSDDIRGKISELSEKAKPGDLFWLYISTHGGEGKLSMSGWFDNYDVAELQTDVRKFNSGVTVVGVVMACHSGSMIGNGVGSDKIISWLLDAGAADCRPSIAWITSCGYGQVSLLYGNAESTPTPFGVSFLRNGWQQGYADGPLLGTTWQGGDGDGKVTFYELMRYAAVFCKGYSDDVAPAGVRFENDELLKRVFAGTAGPGGSGLQPDAPANCTASQGHSDASIQVNWTLSHDATVENYWLFRRGPGEMSAHCVARDAGNGEFFDPGTIRKTGESWKFWKGGLDLRNIKPPEAFKVYTYYVRAVSPQGISEPSPEAFGYAGTTIMRQFLESLGIPLDEGTSVAAATMSANGQNSVLDCYVIGIDPTDPNAAFQAELVRKDGKWTARPVGGEKEGRVYRVKAKKTMSDEDWTDVTDVEDLEAEGWRFFRVGVELAE